MYERPQYALRRDLQAIVEAAKNAPQWDTERDCLVNAVPHLRIVRTAEALPLAPPEPRRVTARDTRGLWLVAATAVICAALLFWGLSALADLIAANAVAQASVPGLGRW
jgi:hypothetical protein